VLTLVLTLACRERQRQLGKNVSLNNKLSNPASMQAGYTKSFSLLEFQLYFPQYQFVLSIYMKKDRTVV
jgi:hypothetical protein